jgi:hypothetical protein
MIKLYLLYLLTAFINFSVIVISLDESTGLANYTPILTLAGSVILFSIAAPVMIYKKRVGLFVGLAACLFLLPFSIMLLKGIFMDNGFNWGLLFISTPLILVSLSIYLTIKKISDKTSSSEITFIKISLSAIPVLLFAYYIIDSGEYWSWQIFNM